MALLYCLLYHFEAAVLAPLFMSATKLAIQGQFQLVKTHTILLKMHKFGMK